MNVMLSDQSLVELPQADKDQAWGREAHRETSHSSVFTVPYLLPRTSLSEAAKSQASDRERGCIPNAH